MQPTDRQRFYHPELDGLRFIAFLLVFLHNANPILKGTFFDTFSAYSWFGVDLFFCLSAFLITKLLLTEQQRTGSINIRNFYMRRALRIVPLYFFYIVAGALLMAPLEGRNINLPGHLASLATFTFNFGYFALLPSPVLIYIHLWSISFEEQFYAVIPWSLRGLLRVNTRVVWLSLGAVCLVGTIVRAALIYYQFRHPVIRFLPITNFDSILAGIILGLGLLDQALQKAKPVIALVAGVIVLWALYLLPNNDVIGWNLMLTYPLTGLGAFLVIFSVTRQEQNPFTRFLSHKAMVALGKISYGLYVFHFGIFVLATALLSRWVGVQQLSYPRHTAPVLLLSLALTILLAMISYTVLEKPFLQWKEKFGSISSHPA